MNAPRIRTVWRHVVAIVCTSLLTLSGCGQFDRATVVSNVEITGVSGVLTVTFDLADDDSGVVDVRVAFSLDGGTTYQPATQLMPATASPGGSTTLDGRILGVPAQAGCAVQWDSEAQEIFGNRTIRVRIAPATGIAADSPAIVIQNNSRPTIGTPNGPGTVTGNGPFTASTLLNSSLAFAVSATDADGDALTFSAVIDNVNSTLTAGQAGFANSFPNVTSSPATGGNPTLATLNFSGSASQEGTIVIDLSADDGRAPQSLTKLYITVTGSSVVVSFGLTGIPSPIVAGDATDLTIAAKDSFGATVPTYTGTVSFQSSDPLANLPASYTFTPADNGTHTFVGAVIFGTPGVQSVTVADSSNPSITGSRSNITVASGLIWAKNAAGSAVESESPRGITALADGAVVVAGSFAGQITFGPGEANATTLISQGGRDIYVAKFTIAGDVVWAKHAGSVLDDGNNCDVVALPDGGLLVSGNFQDGAIFGLGEPNQTTVSSSGDTDIFLAKLNADGSLAWVKTAGSPSTDEAMSVDAFADGSAVVVGFFNQTATFGSGEANQTNLATMGARDVFVARYNSDGTLAWAKQAGGADLDWANDVCVLADGTIAVAGIHRGATFGFGEANETTLTNFMAGVGDVFVARFVGDGTLQWAKQTNGASQDQATCVTQLLGGALVVGGNLASANTTFAPGEANETTVTAPGDMFFASYNINGTLNWVKTVGSNQSDEWQNVVGTVDGGFAATGKFESFIIFGFGEPNQTALNSAGASDIFIAKFSSNGSLTWAKRAGGSATPNGDIGRTICELPDESIIVAGVFNFSATFGEGEVNQTTLNGGQWDFFIARYSR